MSRIGKMPVKVPSNVKVSISGSKVRIEGPLGVNEKVFGPGAKMNFADGEIVVEKMDDSRQSEMMYGTVRSIINGMVIGVVSGFQKQLEINGVGFKAILKGNQLDLALGFSHEILYDIPAGIQVLIDGGTKLTVKGFDKKMVGQVTADIKRYYPVEPYKGKGVRIVGEYVRRKEGKKTA